MTQETPTAARRRTFPLSRTRIGLTVALAGLALGACDPGASERDEKIRTAQVNLETLGVSGAAPSAPESRRRAVYNEVLQTLSGVDADSSAADAAAARLLTARAQAGLGAIATDQMLAREREAANQASLLTSALLQYTRYLERAEALEVYDPSADIARVDEKLAQKADEIAQARAALNESNAQREDLERQMEAAIAAAEEDRQAEAEFRARAADVSEVERLGLITSANERRRDADAHDQEASSLRAQLERLAPETRELESELDRHARAVELLSQAKADIQALARINQDEAGKARAAAREIGQQIQQLATAYGEAVQSIEEPFEEAQRRYESAVSSARSAGRDASRTVRTQSTLTAASYQQALADVLAVRASGAASRADVYGALASAPQLSGTANYSSSAQAARQRAEELTTATREAYEEAKNLYESSGGRDERIDRIAERLDMLAKGTAGTPASPEQGVRELAQQMMTSLSPLNVDQLVSNVHADSPEEQQLVDAVAEMVRAGSQLDEALRERFDQGLLQSLGGAGGMMGGMSAGMPSADDLTAQVESFDPSTVEVEVTSETEARMRIPGGTPMVPGAESDWIPVVKRDGRWLVDLELGQDAAVMAPMLQQFGPQITQLFNDLATEVREGAFETPDQFMQAAMPRAMEILGPMMGGQGMPGSGG